MDTQIISVERGEHAVISIARALFGHRSPVTHHQLRRAQPVREASSPAALDLLEDTFAFGSALTLARRSQHRFWRDDQPALRFSGFGPALMRWLAGTALGTARTREFVAKPTTDGDELICYLALEAAAAAGLGRAVALQPGIRSSGLAWLGFPELLAMKGSTDLPSLGLVVGGTGLSLVELLSRDLTGRWVAIEHSKQHIESIERMVGLGQAQTAVLDLLFQTLIDEQRRGSARFVIDAATVLSQSPPPMITALDTGVSVAARARGRRGAAAFCRGIGTLATWVREARAVRFFEDDYASAQEVLGMWETLGDHAYQRLVALADDLESVAAVEDS